MNETTVSAVDNSLAMLLKAEKDFPGYALDFCSGYVSTDGVLLIKKIRQHFGEDEEIIEAMIKQAIEH